MPSTDLMIAFFIAAALFSYMPGPAMLYTTAQTIAQGKRAGWMAALGIHIGGYVHVVAAALGLAILFQTIPILYTVMKFAGAAYLVWLGIQLIRSNATETELKPAPKTKSSRRAFLQSVTVEILNPKTALFYIAFLPQFTDPSASIPIWGQLLLLGTIVNFMFSSADAMCVLLSTKMMALLKQSETAGKWAQRLGGGLLVALGINLALHQK